MAEPVDFKGRTDDFGPSQGNEDRMGRLFVLRNGHNVVSAWQFTREQLEALIESGDPVYVSHWSGTSVFPTFCGTKEEINPLLLDFGSQTVG